MVILIPTKILGPLVMPNHIEHETGTPPSAPVLTHIVNDGSGTFIEWTSDPATSFKIYRGTSTGAYSLLTTVGGGEASYDDTSVVNGTVYYYAVKAVTGAGESDYSNELSAYSLYDATVFVSESGDDITAVPGRADLPYETVNGAIVALNAQNVSSNGIRFIDGADWEVPYTTELEDLLQRGLTFKGHTTNIDLALLDLADGLNHIFGLDNVTVALLSKTPQTNPIALNAGTLTMANGAVVTSMVLDGANGTNGIGGTPGSNRSGLGGSAGSDGDPPLSGGAGESVDESGDPGANGTAGGSAWLITLQSNGIVGAGTITSVTGIGGVGGDGGAGGNGGNATGGGGGNGGNATGTDQNGADGGSGGDATANGGIGGNGGNGGNGSVITKDAGIAITSSTLTAGAGGSAGMGGTAGSSTGGTGGIGGLGSGSGMNGANGADGTATADAGSAGSSGTDGTDGGIV